MTTNTRTLRNKTVWGLIWAGIGQFGSQGIRFVVLLILALLLEPTDFGLLGVAMVFIVFAEAISELGLAAAIIQTEDTSDAIRSTAFWSNLLIGLVLFGVTNQFARPLSVFLGDERAADLLPFLALIFPIRAISVIPRALLTREMDFKGLTAREFGGQITYGVVGVSMALTNGGVWALVAAVIAERTASTILLWYAVDWRPRLIFRWDKLRALTQFGLSAMTSELLNKGLSNIDYFIIGRYLGAEALGYYTLAFQVAVVSQRRLVGIVRRVAFPALVEIQHDRERLRDSFNKGIRYIFMVITPLSMLIASLAPLFITTAYSSKWMSTILPLQILTLVALAYGIDLSESLYYALGRPIFRTVFISVRIGIFVLLAIPLSRAAGIVGVASALAVAAAISALLNLVLVRRLVAISLVTTGRMLLPSLAATLVAVGPTVFIATYLPTYINGWATFVIAGCVGIIIYVAALLLLSPQLAKQAKIHAERLQDRIKKGRLAKE